MLFAIPLAFFFFFISDKFVPFFFGVGYDGAIIPMKICSFLILVSNMSYFASVQILAMYSFEKEFLLSTIAGMLFNIVGNFCLISTYGAIGASIASLIGELAVTFVSFYFVYRNGLYKLRWSYLFKCVFSGISFFMIYRFMIPAGLTPLCWLIVFSLLSWCCYFLIQLLVFKNTYCLMIIKTFQYNMLK